MTGRPAGRTVLLVRHAKSDQHVGGADHDRPLNPRGRRDAPALGGWLDEHAPPIDLVLCSSARRAQETWQLASENMRDVPRAEVRTSLYLASPQAVLQQLRELADDVRVVAVVGHEPTQSALVDMLAGEADPVATQCLSDGFTTAAVATLTMARPWTALGPRTCRLAGFAVPRG